MLLFLLTAREGRLCAEEARREKARARSWLVVQAAGTDVCAETNPAVAGTHPRRRKWLPFIPPLTLIDQYVVCCEVRAYRQMRAAAPLSRAADIDMALFGLSLSVWPLPNIRDFAAGAAPRR